MSTAESATPKRTCGADRSPQTDDACFDPESTGEVRRFTASDGYEFVYRNFPPHSNPPKGYVVALHGIQSHSGWYGYSSGRMSAAGYDVRFLDRRGSGLNQTDRGHAPHEDRLISDVVQFLSHVCAERNREAPMVAVTLLGVSWGGKLAAAVAALRPEFVDSLALLYPGIRPRIQPTLLQRIQLRLAETFDVRRKIAPIPLSDPALFTHESRWQDRIRSDAFALHEATSGFFLSSASLDQLVDRSNEAIQCPTLLMLAGGDRIIDNPATKSYFDRLSSTDKTLIEYKDAAHTLEFEPNREAVFSDLIEWLNSLRRCNST